MPSFLEREQLLPTTPYIAPADQILGAFNTEQSLFGIGAAQVNRASHEYNNLPLTNPQNQQQLNGLLDTANSKLKSVSMTNLAVGQNQDAALAVFDPILKDQDIMGDNALTQSWGRSQAKAENDRVSNGGKNYNQASVDAVNYQQALFAKSDKGSWRNFYTNRETYSPYYDTTGEMGRLQKMFSTDVIEKDQQNGAYITTTKDSSWYKDKWQQFVETNASPQLKAQLATQSRAEYYRDMLTMPKDQIVQKYTTMRNNLIQKQMGVDYQNMMNLGASLAMFHDSKDNAPLRAQLVAQAKYLETQYDAKKQALGSPLEGQDALGTIEGMSMGSRVAEELGLRQYFDRVGDSFAHKEEKMTIKPDYAFLSLKRIGESAREFNIRETETNRHNRATEQHLTNMEDIDRIKAMAELARAQGKKKGSGDDSDDDDPTNKDGGGPQPSSKESPQSDSEQTRKEGQTILDKLGNTEKQYNQVYDDISTQVFSSNLMGTMKTFLNDPTKQNYTLKELPDPTKGTDGSGGNANRLAKFLAAAGYLQDSQGNFVDNPAVAYGLTIGQINDKLREIWSDPAMFKKGLEAIKGNDPSINTYAISAELEKRKQRIDGEHQDIVNQALPALRTNLGKYGSLFEQDYFSKGKIPTRDEVRAVMNNVPTSALESELSAGDIGWGNKFKHAIGAMSQDDLYRETMTDQVMKNITTTLGVNRTAYNSYYQDYMPEKGDPSKDTEYQKNLEILLEGAERQTKGMDKQTKRAMEYARQYPASVKYIRMNSADEAHNLPYMQIYFKEPTTKEEKEDYPVSGLEMSTTNANRKFFEAPYDDRTTLLNNKALRFQVDYKDGTKTNLSIYNASGSKENPQFDLNPDFSYKTLDIDPATGNIKGVATIYRADEVNNLTKGRPNLLPLALSQDPTGVYNTLANKLIKNRDAVNAYLDSKGGITNVRQLPDYIKTAITNPF